MLSGFKKFIMQGNVIDLAVGIIIGGVFGAVVKSFTDDILMALIGAIVGKPNFGDLVAHIGDSEIRYGLFINALIAFLLTAAAIYFFIVMPMNKMIERRNRREMPEVEPTNEEKIVLLLQQIANK